MPELVVAPRIVITWPRLSNYKERPHVKNIIRKVQKKFCVEENFLPFGIMSCSNESFDGRMQKGLAKRTIVSTPIIHTLMMVILSS